MLNKTTENSNQFERARLQKCFLFFAKLSTFFLLSKKSNTMLHFPDW